jgi:hypothetical protein
MTVTFMRKLSVIEAAQADDFTGFVRALFRLRHNPDAIERAFRELATVTVTSGFQVAAVWLHAKYGKKMREWANDDANLAAAYRKLLPPYTGPALRLYRGDSADNHSTREYGLAWTSNQIIAELFASGGWRALGESVLVESVVPPEAIICDIGQHGFSHHLENEYLVDRRLLGAVTVIKRWPQRSKEENEFWDRGGDEIASAMILRMMAKSLNRMFPSGKHCDW